MSAPFGPKTMKALKEVLAWWSRTGGNFGGVESTPANMPTVRWAKPHEEEGETWEHLPEDRIYPFELGVINSSKAFVGNESWVDVWAADGPIVKDRPLLIRYTAGDSYNDAPGFWTPVTFATGHLSGVTVDTIGAGGTATVNVDGLGLMELTNWSGRTVPAGKACRVNWNYMTHVWEILVANC